MLSETITIPPHDGYPLFLTAKRYWTSSPASQCSDASTLLCLHGTSFHKESWEPTLEKIFDLASFGGSVWIREAWTLDCPNHGASAVLNEATLQTPEFYLNFNCEKYAQAAHRFLLSKSVHGIDFRTRNLVGVGHSLGGVAMTMLQYMSPTVPFSSIILVEPLLSPAGAHHLKKLRSILIKGAYERRDVWPDLTTAMASLKRHDRKKKWDPRIQQLFIRHATRPHPGSYHVRNPYTGFSLACTRDQEAAMYRDPEGATKPIADLNKACASRPVHLVLGGIYDFLPKRVHEAIVDPSSGRHFASITTIPESGHLVPQEQPDILGEIIFNALISNRTPLRRSKL
ncbi:Alpha/beta hydrolase fold-1 [Desarmillaria ectypa]|nr:Alpha/beta hydrolase fold-1 [Desarmillaria ectypa]